MSFVPKKQTYNARINEVVLGVGETAVTIGGQNVLAFHTFDAEIANAPKIGVELTDAGMGMCTMPGEQKFYEGCATVADMAKRAETMEGASFICLHLEGADPNGENKSVDECVALAKSVADATDMPLVIMGCKNIEKDTELFNKIAEALSGKNILVLSARDENYKAIGAGAGLAYGHKSNFVFHVSNLLSIFYRILFGFFSIQERTTGFRDEERVRPAFFQSATNITAFFELFNLFEYCVRLISEIFRFCHFRNSHSRQATCRSVLTKN